MTHLSLLVIAYNSVSDVQSTKLYLIEYFLTGCLAASFLRDRLQQFIDKIFTFFLINITSFTIKKQRKPISMFTMILNFIFFVPIILPLILFACTISAPLLPLFTFPFFIISFPRNKKFWPQKNKFFSFTTNSNSNTLKNKNGDSCFYAQLESSLIESFKELTLTGSIGSSIQPDTFYLSRFQDRIIWIQILESSNSYLIINLKGLELQETSCHTQEAQYIDDSFELAFENPFGADSNVKKSVKKCLKFNPNPLNCLLQKDILIFDGYSDAKNSMTGILDNPDCLKLISAFYAKILSYFLVKYLVNNNSNKNQNIQLNINSLDVFNNSHMKEINEKPNAIVSEVIFENKAFSAKSNKTNSDLNLVDNNQADDWSDDDSIYSLKTKNAVKSSASKVKTDNQNEEDNPFDFDINQILGLGETKNNKVLEKDEKNENIHISKTIKNSEKKKQDYFDDFVKISSSISNKQNNDRLAQSRSSTAANTYTSLLSLPNSWLNFLNENQNVSHSLNNESFKKSISSKDWIEKILEIISSNKLLKDKNDIIVDYETNTWTSHYKFILKCCEAMNLLNENTITGVYNPQSVAKFFKGDLPYSILNEKLAKQLPELANLLVNAFRFDIFKFNFFS
jgi:hypothetical protein